MGRASVPILVSIQLRFQPANIAKQWMDEAPLIRT